MSSRKLVKVNGTPESNPKAWGLKAFEFNTWSKWSYWDEKANFGSTYDYYYYDNLEVDGGDKDEKTCDSKNEYCVCDEIEASGVQGRKIY